jgi:hypothetical protein
MDVNDAGNPDTGAAKLCLDVLAHPILQDRLFVVIWVAGIRRAPKTHEVGIHEPSRALPHDRAGAVGDGPAEYEPWWRAVRRDPYTIETHDTYRHHYSGKPDIHKIYVESIATGKVEGRTLGDELAERLKEPVPPFVAWENSRPDIGELFRVGEDYKNMGARRWFSGAFCRRRKATEHCGTGEGSGNCWKGSHN